MTLIRRSYHPQTQAKIERWHWSMLNQILLDNYYLPEELQKYLHQFENYYNHESYNNLTPADVIYGRDQEALDEQEKIKLILCRYDVKCITITETD